MKTVLVTGAAGFIGFHVCQRLLREGYRVTGLDNFSDYYDVNLKRDRVKNIGVNQRFEFHHADIADKDALGTLFENTRPQWVVHLAAQASVRYSINHPQPYIDSNLVGFFNMLECCRRSQVEHLVYASSSSVYGANAKVPFSVKDNVDHPVSLYAATKKANELMAHSYSHLYRIPTTGLRFFTVYGPWGRPDMAYFSFTRSILEGKPIDVFNNGDMRRDFTYIDDIVEGIVKLLPVIPQPDPQWDATAPNPATSSAPYRLFNIGNHAPVKLLRMIEILEERLGRKATKNYLPMQAGDVPATYADIDDLTSAVGFKPKMSIEQGISRFVEWYRGYYSI